MHTKADLISSLRCMLGDMFAAKASGQSYARLARAHGYVDGYMRALLDVGAATKEELLEIVGAEREKAGGPALGAARSDESGECHYPDRSGSRSAKIRAA